MENKIYMQYMETVKSLYQKNRALGLYLMKMKIHVVEDGRFDTAFTDSHSIFISRNLHDLCTTLNRKEFILAHEALHRIFGHFSKEHRVFIDHNINSELHLAVYNLACELEVNLWIKKNLDADIFLPQPPVKDRWVAANMNAFELYDDIINDAGYFELVISDYAD